MKQLGRRSWSTRGVVLAWLLSACSTPAATPATAPAASAQPGPSGVSAAPAASDHRTSTTTATAAPHSSGTAQATAATKGPDVKPKRSAADAVALQEMAPEKVEQVRTEAVSSLALDPQKDKIAALGQPPMIRERGNWRALPLPAALAAPEGAREVTRIYFGRDNQPRIMGTRWLADGAVEQVYLRFRHGRWKREPRELASFAGKPAAPLYGVLGLADPEVLCKLGKQCLIKQRSGWSEVPLPIAPPARPVRVDVTGKAAYALLGKQLLRLGKKAWHAVGARGAWQKEPASAWLSGDEAWVSVPGEDALYRYAEGAWKRQDAPLSGPRGLWMDGHQQLWLAADGGAAVLRQGRWWRVKGITGPVSEVVGHGTTVYFAGRSGLWAATLPSGTGEGTG